jgi:hypothetical protein
VVAAPLLSPILIPRARRFILPDKIAAIIGSDSNGLRVKSPAGDRIGSVDIRYDDGFVSYIPEGFSYGPPN